MRRILYGTQDHLTYYLLVDELANGLESYGIAVAAGENEEHRLRCITMSQTRIEALLGRLLRGGVTPVATRDVVDDFLLE